MIMSHRPACVCVCISGFKGAVPVDQRENIPLNVPFRMSPGTLLQIRAERTVTPLTERFADFLTFFAGNKDIHLMIMLVFVTSFAPGTVCPAFRTSMIIFLFGSGSRYRRYSEGAVIMKESSRSTDCVSR